MNLSLTPLIKDPFKNKLQLGGKGSRCSCILNIQKVNVLMQTGHLPKLIDYLPHNIDMYLLIQKVSEKVKKNT